MKKVQEPHVGIVFLVQNRLYVDSTLVSQAEEYGVFKVHSAGHPDFWQTLGLPGEYEEHPRGRCQHNSPTGEWTLLLDRCIIQQPSLVAKILRRLNLPLETKVGLDSHYRCRVCLRG